MRFAKPTAKPTATPMPEFEDLVAVATATPGPGVTIAPKDDEDVLAMMGAPLSRLSFEDQRIVRGGSARATRALNCDTANLNRQLIATGSTVGMRKVDAAAERFKGKMSEIAHN